MNLSFLPAVNATLNGLAVVFLVAGLVSIKQRRINAHRNWMVGAFVLSSLFLICYVIHYYWRYVTYGGAHTKFYGADPVRYFYYAVLASHILLATGLPVLAIIQLYLGFKRYDTIHRRFGKVVLPIWLYVSVTGVVIYLMLYHLNAHVAGV